MKSKVKEFITKYYDGHSAECLDQKDQARLIAIYYVNEDDETEVEIIRYTGEEIDLYLSDRDLLDSVFEHGYNYYAKRELEKSQYDFAL